MTQNYYFAVKPDSATHKILSGMEAAGKAVLEALDIAEKFSTTAVPVQITLNSIPRAISLIPQFSRDDRRGRQIQDGIRHTLENLNVRIGQSFFEDGRVTPFIPPELVTAEANRLPVFDYKLISAMKAIALGINSLRFDKDVLAEICTGFVGTSNSAVLGIRQLDRPSDPIDARIIYGTWVIRIQTLPSKVDNAFTPANCRRITEDDVSEMAKPGNFNDFSCVYSVAKRRLGSLPKIIARAAPRM
jgi:hypothetical protein